MEYFNKILCVTKDELTGGDNPIIMYRTLLSNVGRGNIVNVHRGGGEGSQALYAWTSLPEKYRKRYMERYGDPEQKMKETMLKDRVKLDGEVREWYEAFI